MAGRVRHIETTENVGVDAQRIERLADGDVAVAVAALVVGVVPGVEAAVGGAAGAPGEDVRVAPVGVMGVV
jgi:hypothetical protein